MAQPSVYPATGRVKRLQRKVPAVVYLLDDLPQRTTVPGSVLTDNTSLSRVLGHIYLEESRGATNQSKREGEG